MRTLLLSLLTSLVLSDGPDPYFMIKCRPKLKPSTYWDSNTNEKFTGTWYIVADLPNLSMKSAKMGYTCPKFTFEMTTTSKKLSKDENGNNEGNLYRMTAEQKDPEGNKIEYNGYLDVVSLGGINFDIRDKSGDFKRIKRGRRKQKSFHKILDTDDGESYMYIYTCEKLTASPKRSTVIWILSRNKTGYVKDLSDDENYDYIDWHIQKAGKLARPDIGGKIWAMLYKYMNRNKFDTCDEE